MGRKLRGMDLKDAIAKRPLLGKTAYKARVRAVCSSKKAQTVAASQVKIMKRVCKAIELKTGGATSF